MACIACGSCPTRLLVDVHNIPIVANDLLETSEAATTAPCGDMRIHYCDECHHFFNDAFDPDLISYSENYETSLHFSPVFQEYAADLVRKLVDDYGVANQRILEIGCGRGEFLNSLCAGGENEGIGFDTSYDGGRTISERHPKVEIFDTYFDSSLELDAIDLVVSQQVLEHVEDPQAFLSNVLGHPAVRSNNALLYLEVPNGLYTFKKDGVWDLIYEHVSYFSPDSLARLVRTCECEIVESGESYGGQYLYVVARVGGAVGTPHEPALDYAFVDGFTDRFSAKLDHWQAQLADDVTASRTYVWGAGSKGITFCNILDPTARLGGLVDRHPNKVGKFIGATGLKIVSGTDLVPRATERVVVMNPLYAEEIRLELEAAGLSVEMLLA